MALMENEIQNNFISLSEQKSLNSEIDIYRENQINYAIYLFNLHKIFISFEKKTINL